EIENISVVIVAGDRPDGAALRQDAAHFIVSPSGSAGAVAHGSAIALGVRISLRRRCNGATGERVVVIGELDRRRAAIVVSLFCKTVNGVIVVRRDHRACAALVWLGGRLGQDVAVAVIGVADCAGLRVAGTGQARKAIVGEAPHAPGAGAVTA